MQTRLSDWTNFSPRASISWTLPGRKTTLRSSIGVWSQFFESGLYEQTLWANGQQQRDIVISNPGLPRSVSRRHSARRAAAQHRARASRHRDAVHAARVGRRRSHVDGLGETARDLFASDWAQPVSQPRSECADQRRAAGPDAAQHHAARVDRAIAERVARSERDAEPSAAPLQRQRRLHARAKR